MSCPDSQHDPYTKSSPGPRPRAGQVRDGGYCNRFMPPLPLNTICRCCAKCGSGERSKHCDRLRRRHSRLVVSICRTPGCQLLVQVGHTTCCSSCWLSHGGLRARGCAKPHTPSCSHSCDILLCHLGPGWRGDGGHSSRGSVWTVAPMIVVVSSSEGGSGSVTGPSSDLGDGVLPEPGQGQPAGTGGLPLVGLERQLTRPLCSGLISGAAEAPMADYPKF